MIHHLVLIVHLVCATIWVGGHLILSLRILPIAWKKKEIGEIVEFRRKYERIGMPALILLFLTGVIMAYHYNATVTTWFSFASAVEKVVSSKLILLGLTFSLAWSADRFLFPKLTDKDLPKITLFIVTVTTIAVAMLVLGSLVRIGGIT
jgi:putative copper export protein